MKQPMHNPEGHVLRKKYKGLEEYVYLPGTGNGKGRWDYRGPDYVCLLDAKTFVRRRLLLFFLVTLECVCVVCVGLLDTPGLRSLVVTVPFLAALGFAGASLASAALLLGGGNVLSRRRHERAVKVFVKRQKGLLLSGALLLTGGAFFVVRGGAPAGEAPAFAAAATLTAAAFTACRLLARLPFEERHHEAGGENPGSS